MQVLAEAEVLYLVIETSGRDALPFAGMVFITVVELLCNI